MKIFSFDKFSHSPVDGFSVVVVVVVVAAAVVVVLAVVVDERTD